MAKEKLSPDQRFNLTLLFGLIGALVFAFAAKPFFNVSPLAGGIGGLILGLRMGNIFFRKSKREEKTREYPPLHAKLPPELRDSYYSDRFMERIMEVYQPQQTTSKGKTEEVEDPYAVDEQGWEAIFGSATKNADDSSRENLEDTAIDFWQALAYPTQLPTTLAVMWLIIFCGMGLIFFPQDMFASDQGIAIIRFILVPSCVLTGISGILVLSRKTTSNLFGWMVYDREAILDGIAKILIGLAGCIFSFYYL